jgi:hypothetical protein
MSLSDTDPAVEVKQTVFGSGSNTTILKVQARASNEIQAMMQVITYLSSEAENAEEPLDFVKERDWNKKINVRFTNYRPQIEKDLQTLVPLYRDKYRLAWAQSGISEGRRNEISALLSVKSRTELATCNGNPITALDNLAKWLADQASKTLKDNQAYSEAAIRYFLYTEFQRCNIFPNEVVVS